MASEVARLRSRLSDLFSSIATALSPNRSSRGGAGIRGVVIHTTESAPGSLWGVVNYFKNDGIDVSSHYVVGDIARKGSLWTEVVRVVPEEEKAWTAKSANPYFVQYELIGRANRTRTEWLAHRAQLETVAALVAEDVLQYDIPIVRGYPGIVGHGDLDRLGFPNDHTDPGPNFPWDVFLDAVRRYVTIGEAPDVTEVRVKLRPGSCLPNTWSRVPRWAWRWAEWIRAGRRGSMPVSGLNDQQREAFYLWFKCKFLGTRAH